MKGRELDRYVELSAAACTGCQKAHVRIGWAHTDLNKAARWASRNASPRNLAALATAQAKLREARDQALEHLATHEKEEAHASDQGTRLADQPDRPAHGDDRAQGVAAH